MRITSLMCAEHLKPGNVTGFVFIILLQDPKRHLEENVDVLMTTNIVQCLGAMLNSVVF